MKHALFNTSDVKANLVSYICPKNPVCYGIPQVRLMFDSTKNNFTVNNKKKQNTKREKKMVPSKTLSITSQCFNLYRTR